MISVVVDAWHLLRQACSPCRPGFLTIPGALDNGSRTTAVRAGQKAGNCPAVRAGQRQAITQQ
jgi:hypothetical protein